MPAHKIVSSDQSPAITGYRHAPYRDIFIGHLSFSVRDKIDRPILTSSWVQVFSPKSQIFTLPAWSQLINSP
jgi:hypothetical protein